MNVYPFIEAEKADGGNVARTCTLFQVSRSAYYAQRGDTVCTRDGVDAELTTQITTVHTQSAGTCGAPRIHAVLASRGRWHGRSRRPPRTS